MHLVVFLLGSSIFLGFASGLDATTAPVPPAAAKELSGMVAVHRIATKEDLEVLTDALTKVARDRSHWAYTEATLRKDEKGRVKDDRIIRHDPSKPYDEQDVPLRLDGKPPTESQLKDFRSRGEKRGRRAEAGEPANPNSFANQSLGDLVDLDRALIVAEGAGRATYELPLRKVGNTRFPPEKFQVFVRVNRDAHALEYAAAKLREPLRTKVVVKISAGEASADFTTVDPKFAPAMTAVRGNASASILFYSIGGNLEINRTDLKHVRPFADRFDVQIGPLKALDF